MAGATGSLLLSAQACEASPRSHATQSRSEPTTTEPDGPLSRLVAIAPPVTQPVNRPRLESGRGWLHLTWTQHGLGGRGDTLVFTARSLEDARWRDLTSLSQNVASSSPVFTANAPTRKVAVSWSAPIGGGQLRPWIATTQDAGRRFSAPEILALPTDDSRASSALIAAPMQPGGPWTAAVPRPVPPRPEVRPTPAVSDAASHAWSPLRVPPGAVDDADGGFRALTTCAGGGALGLWCGAAGAASLATIAVHHPLGEDVRCVPAQRPLVCRGNRIAVALGSARSRKTWLWAGRSPSSLRRVARLPGATAEIIRVDWTDDAHLVAVWIDEARSLNAMTVAVADGRVRTTLLAGEVVEASAAADAEGETLYLAWTTEIPPDHRPRPLGPTDGRGLLHLGSVALRGGMLSNPLDPSPLDPPDATR